jgi:large subunit ribosomal protein L33
MNKLVEQLETMFLTDGDVSKDAGGAGRGVLGGVRAARPLPRQRIVLACSQCGNRNYRKTKARREGASPLSLSKFCSICSAHTQHREAV